MRTLLVTIAAVIGLSAMAQDRAAQTTPQERAKEQTELVTRELGLDATQAEKAASINLAYETQMVNIAAMKNETEREGRRNEMEAIRNRAYGSILTPEQLDRWKAMQQAAKAGN